MSDTSGAKASGETVYPVFLMDGGPPNQLLLTSSLRFNDVLDAEKLRQALSELLTIGDWKMLAGRICERVLSIFPRPLSIKCKLTGGVDQNFLGGARARLLFAFGA